MCGSKRSIEEAATREEDAESSFWALPWSSTAAASSGTGTFPTLYSYQIQQGDPDFGSYHRINPVFQFYCSNSVFGSDLTEIHIRPFKKESEIKLPEFDQVRINNFACKDG